jgi:Nitroreductase
MITALEFENIFANVPEGKLAEVPGDLHPLIRHRWSPYAFSEKPVTDRDLRLLLEAARWAPSSYNEQPWRFIVAPRTDTGGPHKTARHLGPHESRMGPDGAGSDSERRQNHVLS